MRLHFELSFAGHVLTLSPSKSEADAKSTPPLLDQLAEDIEHIRDHGEHGKHPEAKHMADWVLAHIDYLLLTNGRERREDATQGDAASNLNGVRTGRTVPLKTPLQGATGWRTSPDSAADLARAEARRVADELGQPEKTYLGYKVRVVPGSIGYDDLEQYVECSECHTRTPHLDSAGERCTQCVETEDHSGAHQCNGVMVQRPYDPIYGYGWPGEALK